jgi:hypothetical protein
MSVLCNPALVAALHQYKLRDHQVPSTPIHTLTVRNNLWCHSKDGCPWRRRPPRSAAAAAFDRHSRPRWGHRRAGRRRRRAPEPYGTHVPRLLHRRRRRPRHAHRFPPRPRRPRGHPRAPPPLQQHPGTLRSLRSWVDTVDLCRCASASVQPNFGKPPTKVMVPNHEHERALMT